MHEAWAVCCSGIKPEGLQREETVESCECRYGKFSVPQNWLFLIALTDLTFAENG